ncbi:MAG: hypothetical protein RQ922_03945 [Thermoproteota archaeon]|nr:hypothetical protein [Thermoproteota archaeon]
MDIKTTFIALTSIIILAVVGIIILYQTNPANTVNTNTAVVNTFLTEKFRTYTIPIYTSPILSCTKPFNKNYMGWVPISELSKYVRVMETLNPEYEKNPLLHLKLLIDNYIVVHAKVVSLGEAYQGHYFIPAIYHLRYKILILDIILNKSPLQLSVGETIDIYDIAYNLEVLKEMAYRQTTNVTAPKLIEKVDPRNFTYIIMPLDVGNEYILALQVKSNEPSKIFVIWHYFVFDSKIYSPDNVAYPVDSEPLITTFYKVCGMPLSDFINLIKYVNS